LVFLKIKGKNLNVIETQKNIGYKGVDSISTIELESNNNDFVKTVN